MKNERDIEIRWLAFPLHPDTPEEGLTLKELFAGRDVDIAAIEKRLQAVADSLSLPLGARAKTYNSRLAQELSKWAESKGKGEKFHHAVFRAYFAEGRNIALVDELAALAESAGLPAEEARRVVLSREFRRAVDDDWERSRALGISAVPTFIAGSKRLVGFQPYEALAALVNGSY